MKTKEFNPTQEQIQAIGKALHEFHQTYEGFSQGSVREAVKDTLNKVIHEIHITGSAEEIHGLDNFAGMVESLSELMNELFSDRVTPAIKAMEPEPSIKAA